MMDVLNVCIFSHLFPFYIHKRPCSAAKTAGFPDNVWRTAEPCLVLYLHCFNKHARIFQRKQKSHIILFVIKYRSSNIVLFNPANSCICFDMAYVHTYICIRMKLYVLHLLNTFMYVIFACRAECKSPLMYKMPCRYPSSFYVTPVGFYSSV